MKNWKTRILAPTLVILMCGLGGWTLFLQITTDVENLPPAEVMAEFAALRAGMRDVPPMLLTTPDGDVVPNPESVDDPAAKPGWVKVRYYDAAAGRLVRAELPFWWVRLKQIAFEFLLRRAGVEPENLGVSVDDLNRHGTGVVIDDVRAGGDILLIWME